MDEGRVKRLLAFLLVSIWLGSAQAQTSAVDQKIETKVMADLRQNPEPHSMSSSANRGM